MYNRSIILDSSEEIVTTTTITSTRLKMEESDTDLQQEVHHSD